VLHFNFISTRSHARDRLLIYVERRRRFSFTISQELRGAEKSTREVHSGRYGPIHLLSRRVRIGQMKLTSELWTTRGVLPGTAGHASLQLQQRLEQSQRAAATSARHDRRDWMLSQRSRPVPPVPLDDAASCPARRVVAITTAIGKGQWYSELIRIEIFHRKDLETSVTSPSNAMSYENLTEVDRLDLLDRAELINKRKSGISDRTEEAILNIHIYDRYYRGPLLALPLDLFFLLFLLYYS